MLRAHLLCLGLVGLVVTTAGVARADVGVEKCPDPSYIQTGTQGCVKRPPPGPGDEYVIALQIIAKEPKRAFQLLEHSCKLQHAASCSQLAELYKSGRARVVQKDLKKATSLFELGCKLKDTHSCQVRANVAMDAKEYAVARGWLEKACVKDDKLADGIACAQLGHLLTQGMGGDADEVGGKARFVKAHKILDAHCTQAIKGRDGQACFVRGYLADKAIGEPEDKAKALAAYRMSCDANDSDGCGFLALRLDDTDRVESMRWYRRACDLDRADSCTTAAGRLSDADHASTLPLELAQKGCDLDTKQCVTLARLNELGRGMAKPDQNRATAIYKSTCDAGDQDTCVVLARRIHDGTGMAADPKRAETMLEASCTAENADACQILSKYVEDAHTDDGRAFKLADSGCKLGSKHACYMVGWMVKNNRRGTPKLEPAQAGAEALPFFERACEKESAFGCDEAGIIYGNGLGVKKDTAMAAKRYAIACKDDDNTQPHACAALADLHATGDGVGKDMTAAVHLSARACAHDYPSACDWLPGHVGEPALLKAAVDELQPGCSAGADDVCYSLVTLLQHGTVADKHRAADLVTAGCQRKHAKSCLEQAQMMYYGFGIVEDKPKAEAMYKQYCDDGDGQACQRLAIIALADKKDAVMALRYGDQACKLDIADGCNHAGYIYYTAQSGVTWDMKKAATYMTKACDLKSSFGCSNVAIFYEYGITRPQDHKKAFELYSQACELGSQPGCGGVGHYQFTGQGGQKIDLELAKGNLTGACDAENVESCAELADLLERQHASTPSDIESMRIRAFSLAGVQAKTNPGARYWLGTFYRDGVGTLKDPKKALEAFEQACEGFDPLGCLTSGKLLIGSTGPGDRERALQSFKSACAGGIDEGCTLKDGGGGGNAVAPGPGKVQAKGCGCRGTAGSRGGAMVLVIVVGLTLRRRRS